MIYKAFNEVYMKFKMHFYHEVFKKLGARETSLTTVETFCMEIIYALGRPTVTEFAKFTNLSSANAADKVNNLIRKGYINKVQDEKDKRRFYLEVTQKYIDYYNISYRYLQVVMERVEEKFSEEELEVLNKVLTVMSKDLMDVSEEVN